MSSASPLTSAPIHAEPTPARWTNYLGYWAPHGFILGFCGILLGAFYYQFGAGEYPCPLCMLQRMAMILACIGPLWIVREIRRRQLTPSDIASAYGLSVLAAVLGAYLSTRQILLHIVPPDPGYGGTVLGLHLYTWALVTFVVVIVYVALAMVFAKATYPAVPTGSLALYSHRGVVGLLLLLIAANLAAVFFEEGFNWTLPGDPNSYQLFQQLGLGCGGLERLQWAGTGTLCLSG